MGAIDPVGIGAVRDCDTCSITGRGGQREGQREAVRETGQLDRLAVEATVRDGQ